MDAGRRSGLLDICARLTNVAYTETVISATEITHAAWMSIDYFNKNRFRLVIVDSGAVNALFLHRRDSLCVNING